jgi:type II secretion system protein G
MYKKGFTLIELLVVIAIIGILSSVVLASLNSARQKSRDARRIGDIKQLQLALEMYYDSTNSYPQALTALVPDYIPTEPMDPQNTTTPYDYAPNAASDATSYVLRATLETDHTALDNDIDGTVNTVACGDPSDGSSTTLYYCVQP